MELIVVMAVVSLLAALLMPTLSALREQAHRVMCMSNQRQLGGAMLSYAADNNERLPVSEVLDAGMPQELMASKLEMVGEQHSQWDGLGLLYWLDYCGEAECYYCPSHHGEHRYEDVQDEWTDFMTNTTIYTNYHYAGHKDWVTGELRDANAGERLVLLTDGLRTQLDYNHGVGMNIAVGDGSVRWRDDVLSLGDNLPESGEMGSAELDGYRRVWDVVYEIFSPGNAGLQDEQD